MKKTSSEPSGKRSPFETSVAAASLSERPSDLPIISKTKWVLGAIAALGITFASGASFLSLTGGTNNHTKEEMEAASKKHDEMGKKVAKGEIPKTIYRECGGEENPYDNPLRNTLGDIVGAGYKRSVPGLINKPSGYAWRLMVYPPTVYRINTVANCLEGKIPGLNLDTAP